jgi:hypothetical protein
MTPAEELRYAAQKVRHLGAVATAGPWTCSAVWSPDSKSTSGIYSLAHPTGTVASEVVASGRVKPGYGGIRNPHNAVWITLMQPAIAEPLADWLESCAIQAGKVTDPRNQEIIADQHALKVARQINGGAS